MKFSLNHKQKTNLKLVAITVITLCSMCSYTFNQERRIANFRYALEPGEKKILNHLVDVFLSIVQKNNLTYMLYSGSLLGSYRHHDIIPWDDDVDFLLPASQQDVFLEALMALPEETYGLFTSGKPYKLFLKKSSEINWAYSTLVKWPYSWEFPFMDIFFYEEEGEYVIDPGYIAGVQYWFKKSDIFPLKERPFLGRMLRSPNNPEGFLSTLYEPGLCETTKQRHTDERARWPVKVNCRVLEPSFPFVQREKTEKGINETLRIDGAVISWWLDQR